jgi:oxygen-independent coproporphyrinogen-3 oxidase
MMMSLTKLRRHIHTYPLKFERADGTAIFPLERAALYVHIPFCSTKCHFCDFAVYVNRNAEAREEYVNLLCREIETFAGLRALPSYRIDALYFGGGTPGLLTAEQLIRVLDVCRAAYPFEPDAEIGVEFDPASVTTEKLIALREAGFNRLSIGVQSFDDSVLRHSNRPHDRAAIYGACEAAAAAEFPNLNLDLIYPLPGVTREAWIDSVQRALELAPSCLTLYALELWPGTAYHKWVTNGRIELPPTSEEVRMYEEGADLVEASGFVPASTNAFRHPDRTPRYSTFLEYYWKTLPLLGFGVSARSAAAGRIWAHTRDLQAWQRSVSEGRQPVEFHTRLTRRQEMRRVMLRGLKTLALSRSEFIERFGVAMEAVFDSELRDLAAAGLIAWEPDRVVLTRKGRAYCTNLFDRFLTEDDRTPLSEGEVQWGVSGLLQEAS